MTVGSWDRSVPDNGSYKKTFTKTWSGADRVRVDYPKAPLVTVHRYSKRQGKVIAITFRKKRSGISRPPKRARDEDHNYAATYLRMVDRKVRFILADGSMTAPFYLMDFTGVTSWFGWDTPSSAFDANDQIKLIGKLREKMSGSDFNLGNVLGEGHQTLRMIGDTAISIAKSLHHLKKGDLAGAARSLLEPANRKPLKPYSQMKPFRANSADILSSKWLELQYGWKPLLSDVEAGAQFVSHKLNVPIQQVYRMSIRKEKANSRTTTGWKYPIVGKSVAVARRSLKITVAEHPSVLQSLGLLNPEVVAWEIMPWSFVIDWFLPIGSWLEARATLSGVVISKNLQSTTVRSSSFCPQSASIVGDTFDVGYNRTIMDRFANTGGPKLPLPRVKPLSEALSVQHCLNGLALLSQVGSGISRRFS